MDVLSGQIRFRKKGYAFITSPNYVRRTSIKGGILSWWAIRAPTIAQSYEF